MYSLFRHAGSILQKKQPIQLTFFVTRKCNARCPFCFYLKSTHPVTPHAAELDLDEISKISSSMGKLMWLAFSGGEIFLRKDLASISEIFYSQNKPSIMLYPTNGLLPELIKDTIEKILKRCRRSTIVVKLSIDGIGQDHDHLRDTPNSFQKTMQCYRLLAPLLEQYPNFEMGVNSVYCSENEDKMDKIIDFAQSLKHINTHTVSMVRGDLLNAHFKNVDPEKYLISANRLKERLREGTASIYKFNGARLKAAQDIIQRQLIRRTLVEKKRRISCYAGKLNLVLTEVGQIYPCEMLSTDFGNIRDYHYDIRQVIRSKKAKSVLMSIRNKQCYCTHECYLMTNILFNPRMYPSLARQYLQLWFSRLFQHHSEPKPVLKDHKYID